MFTEISDWVDGLKSNVFLYSAMLAVILPFALLVLGRLIDALTVGLIRLLARVFGSGKLAYAIVNYLFFPGVMIHESGHALMAFVTGAKVEEVALFRKQGDSLGHVSYRNRGGLILQMLQNALISSAPMYIGTVVLLVFRFLLLRRPEMETWGRVLIGYLGISVFCHMSMSSQDVRIYLKGVLLLIPILFVLILGYRLAFPA